MTLRLGLFRGSKDVPGVSRARAESRALSLQPLYCGAPDRTNARYFTCIDPKGSWHMRTLSGSRMLTATRQLPDPPGGSLRLGCARVDVQDLSRPVRPKMSRLIASKAVQGPKKGSKSSCSRPETSGKRCGTTNTKSCRLGHLGLMLDNLEKRSNNGSDIAF